MLRAVAFGLGLGAGPAHATYSIAAVDQSTQQVGGAVTSCVGTLDVGIVYGSLPGVGVIHAQAQLDQRGRAKQRAIELMMVGVAPSEIIAQISASSFDSAYASRQYGLVDLMGRAAGFTGAQAQAYKRDQQGTSGSFAYSVQGNILTSQKVLDQAVAAFTAGGCDLAERLMAALEAGARGGEGDSRCTGQGIPSDSAFIEVDLPGQSAGGYLKLSVQGTAPQSPLVSLRTQFDAWRKTHPCAAGAAGMAGAAAGGGSGAQGGRGGAGGASGQSGAEAAGPGASAGGVVSSSAGASAAGVGASNAASPGGNGACVAASCVAAGASGASGAAASGAGTIAGAVGRGTNAAGASVASSQTSLQTSEAPAAAGGSCGCVAVASRPLPSTVALAGCGLLALWRLRRLRLRARRHRVANRRSVGPR